MGADGRASRRGPRPADPLVPFEEGLRQRFPSREDVLAEARALTARRRAKRPAAAVALVVALLLGVVGVDPVWRTEEIRTTVGEQRRQALADGSVLVLNTGSTLHIEHRVRSRQFVLAAGEVSFQVAHGWRPFAVRAGEVSVRDIGTAFTVRRHDGGADVTVLEGAVEVLEPGPRSRVLAAGQAVRAVDAGPPQPLRAVDVADAGAWREGRLVFDGTPLAAVLSEIARYRRAPVVLDEPRAGQLRLSGAYDVAGLEALIDALPHVLPVVVRRMADGTVHVAAAEKKS